MTRLIAVLCVAISLLFAADKAGADEKIRIASEGYYPPFNYFDDGGNTNLRRR